MLQKTPMYVVLDTNVIIKDYYFKSKRFETLFNYLSKTPHKMVLPQIVLDELRSNHRQDVAKLSEDFLKIADNARQILGRDDAENKLDVNEEERLYASFLKSFLQEKPVKIIKHDDSHYKKIIERGVRRTAPFKLGKPDYGFKDAIVWETIKDMLNDSAYGTVAFISKNTDQFANIAKDDLHPDLKKETKECPGKILYFNNLEAFLEKYGNRFEHITHSIVDEALQNMIASMKGFGEFSEEQLRPIFEYGFTRPVQQIELGKVVLKSFYVSDIDKGNYILQAVGDAEAEVLYWDPIDNDKWPETIKTDFTATLKYNSAKKT